LVVQEEFSMPAHAVRLPTGCLALVAATVVMSFSTTRIDAQERARPSVPSSFDQLRVLTAPGRRVSVVDASGNRYTGTIAELSSALLTVRVGNELRQLREADVVMLRQRRDDTLRNGALWGLGAGAVGGFLPCGRCHVGPGLMMAGIAGGLGAGVGVGIDAIIRGQATVFQRAGASGTKVTVAPRLSKSHQGVMVSVTF
jgi:hypothetical protein